MAAELFSVAEEAFELGLVVGVVYDEDFVDAGLYECRECVVDHWFVVDGHYLFRDAFRDWVESAAASAC